MKLYLLNANMMQVKLHRYLLMGDPAIRPELDAFKLEREF